VKEAEKVFPHAWVWWFPVLYAIHLLDERLFWIGTADFATQYLGIYFTNAAWLWVNIPSALLMAITAALVVRGRWSQCVVIAMGVHFLAHSLGRVPTSAWHGVVQPGLLSGLLLCAPLGGLALLRAFARFDIRELVLGIAIGTASIQPLWHFALLPWMPDPPIVP
jgi:hypothetical protein